MPRDNEFDQSPISKIIGLPARLWRSAMDRLGDDSIQIKRSPLQWVLAVVTFPFRLLYGLIIFMVIAWTTSRNNYAFIRGLPALMVVAGFGTVIWAAFYFSNRRVRIAQTRARINVYTQQSPDHPEYAEMFSERLVSLVPEDDDAKFQLGLARERAGKNFEALQIYNWLAPLEDTNLNDVLDEGEDINQDGIITSGYSNAHVYLGRLYRVGKLFQMPEEERLDLARHHYDLALKSEEKNYHALLGNADILTSRGKPEEAAIYLEELVQGEIRSTIQLQALPRLIKIRLDLGQERAAKRQVDSVINQFLHAARRNPNNYDMWATLVNCTVIVKDYERAEEIVEEAKRLAVDETVRSKLRLLDSNIWMAKSDDSKAMETKEEFQACLDSLCKAILTSPNNGLAYQRLIPFINLKSDEKLFWLRDSLIGTTNPVIVHVLLGMREIEDGNFVQGQQYWRNADAQIPQIPPLLINNLINISIANDNEVFRNTGDMLAVAIDMYPSDVRLKITQGVYFSRNERLDEAVAILEPILSASPNLFAEKQVLIDCYQKLGNTAKAKIHEEALQTALMGLSTEQRQLVNARLESRK